MTIIYDIIMVGSFLPEKFYFRMQWSLEQHGRSSLPSQTRIPAIYRQVHPARPSCSLRISSFLWIGTVRRTSWGISLLHAVVAECSNVQPSSDGVLPSYNAATSFTSNAAYSFPIHSCTTSSSRRTRSRMKCSHHWKSVWRRHEHC